MENENMPNQSEKKTSVSSFVEIIDSRIKSVFNSLAEKFLRVRTGVVILYDEETSKAVIKFDGSDEATYTYYNKSGEVLSENDTVKVYYTTNITKGWIGARMGAVNRKPDSYSYISVPVANNQEVKYDSIERNILNVNFNVVESDSAVVFAGNQQCTVSANGTLDCTYKVDGETQDFKPSQKFSVGKNIMPHFIPMNLNVGTHNFAIYISSADGGKGATAISDLYGALSGKISGITNISPSNTNLLLYLSGIPDSFVLTIPRLYYTDSSINQTVDWGDDSDPETSTCGSAISHTYVAGGDYTITVKSDSKKFWDTGSYNWKDYLTAIYFPDDAMEIVYTSSLTNCPNLQVIKFGNKANWIEVNFNGNGQKITSIIIPDTTETLKLSNVSSTGVTSLIIPQNVTSFYHLDNISSLKYYEVNCETAPSVCDSANLERVVMGNKVKKLGTDWYYAKYGFRGCTSLKDVRFSSNLTSLCQSAFQDCKALTEIPLLPKVTSIDNYAFLGCTNLAKVTLSDTVESIGNSAFNKCNSLTNINIPKKLKSIGVDTFRSVPAPFIKDDFPTTLTSVGNTAFYNSGVVSARVTAGTTYGYSVFGYCTDLSEAIIDDGVLTVPDSCFEYCTALASVSIPNSVTKIDKRAFYGSGLPRVNLTNGITTIGQSAFQKSSLISVSIPESVTVMSNNVFSECVNMISAEIRDVGFNILPSGTFDSCKSLSSIALGNSINTIDGSAFANCTSLDNIDLSNVVKIGSNAFANCTNLKSVTFGSDVVIESGAFRGTGFVSLTLTQFLAELSSGTTSQGGRYNIGGGAFAYCSNLEEVDNFKYKFTVGLKMTERFLIDGTWETQETDLGARGDALGIYNHWGATSDSVFQNTKLKSASDYLNEHPEYKNESTSTYSRTYSAYNIIPN